MERAREIWTGPFRVEEGQGVLEKVSSGLKDLMTLKNARKLYGARECCREPGSVGVYLTPL